MPRYDSVDAAEMLCRGCQQLDVAAISEDACGRRRRLCKRPIVDKQRCNPDGKCSVMSACAGDAASNENKMSDGGRGRASLGVEGWKSSQKWSAQRSAVRSIAWLDACDASHLRACKTTVSMLCEHRDALVKLNPRCVSIVC